MDQMSYKVDVRNDNFIFGMEEMSIQKPIIRNYGWELLFHEIIKKRFDIFKNNTNKSD